MEVNSDRKTGWIQPEFDGNYRRTRMLDTSKVIE